MSRRADTRKLLKVLERDGVLLVHDRVLPSATSIIAGEPVAGSWWAHPLANDIFDALQPLELVATPVKLIAEKETLVHERLWPELVTIGAGRSRWQLEDLSSDAQALLSAVSRSRRPKPAKDLVPNIEAKARTRAARLLEVKLLVHSDEQHTDTGAHAKFIQTWRGFAREHDVTRRTGAARAYTPFEEVVRTWPAIESKRLLPWPAVADPR